MLSNNLISSPHLNSSPHFSTTNLIGFLVRWFVTPLGGMMGLITGPGPSTLP